VSDMVSAGAKRPKPWRGEAALLMDSFAKEFSDGQPRGRGQRRQPQEGTLYAPAPSHCQIPHLLFRFNLSFLSVIVLQQPDYMQIVNAENERSRRKSAQM